MTPSFAPACTALREGGSKAEPKKGGRVGEVGED